MLSNITSAANAQQLEAITTTEGPLLIIAGPGSGKTFTLVECIVYLLTEKQVAAEQIMVVTFTDKAAQELTTRISNRLDELGLRFNLNEMYLGTFHSICLRWLQDHRELTRLKHNFTLMDEFDQRYFFYQHFAEYKDLPGITHVAGPDTISTWDRSEQLMEWVNKVAEEALDVQTLLETEDEAIQALGRCAQLYHSQLEENNSLDFSTIQYEALRLLHTYPTVRNKLKERIAYVMVDEYQGTNTVQELEEKGSTAQALQVHVRQSVEKVRVMRVRNLFQLVKKPLPAQIDLEMAYVQTDKYRMIHEMRDGFSADSHVTSIEDISALRKRRTFSPYTLVAEIARYLNMPCLEIESLLTNSVSGIEAIVARVNEFNEILYDHIIPRLFNELYTIKEFTAEEPQEIELVRVPERGYYTVSAKPGLVSLEQEHPALASKSFHLDAYSFDSNPEYQFFEEMLPDSQVSKIFFTGMLTHGQSDFFIQYIDPDSHTVRSYYPDFLIQDTQGQYFILEVKRDDQIEAPVVSAKRTFAEKIAAASNMKYVLLKASDAEHGHYQMIWQPAARQRYLDEVIEESEQRAAQGES